VKYKIFSDGASSGNPGPAGCGYVIYDENDNIVFHESRPLGTATNNVAEYSGLLYAIEKVLTFNPESIEIYLDSELIVKQIKGEYKVKNLVLKEYYNKVNSLLKNLKYEINHIPREMNKYADKLAKKACEGNS